MNKFIKYKVMLLLFLVTGASSCNRFLEVHPLGKTTMPVFFSDMDGAKAAMAGIYSKMYVYYSSHFYQYPEIAGDMLSLDLGLATESQKGLYNFNSDPNEEVGAVGKIWSDVYVALSNINNLLFYLPELETRFPQNSEELRSYKAEALFLRALCHFDLSRVYAQPYNYTADASHIGVPILKRTPGPDDNVSRKTVKEVYDFILGDLLEAEKLFEGISPKDPYHVSLTAVQALLSRVYLYKGDWGNSIKYSSLIIQKAPLAQDEAYLEMFIKLSGVEPETIFRLNGQDKSSPLLAFYNKADKINGVEGADPVARPSSNFVGLFMDSEDIRINSLFDEIVITSQNGQVLGSFYVTTKFKAEQAIASNDKQYYNPFVLRVSEMYLNRAEAYFNKGEYTNAANDIKPIIARALNKNVSEIIINDTDKDVLERAIVEERIKELSFEGHRFFDITRRKKNLVREGSSNSEVKLLTYPNDRFILPISQKELDANTNMVGNPTVNN